MRRRALLSTAGVGLSATALGGYLATGGEVPILGKPKPSIPETGGPKRGESDAEVRTKIVEDDPDVEYLEDENAVRYIAYWSSDGGDTPVKTDDMGRRAIYETVPFKKWAGTQLLHVAGAAAAEHVRKVLDTEDIGHGAGRGGGDQPETIAFVSTTTTLDPEGYLVSESEVEFDEFVSATPSTVTAQYRLGGESVEREVPMYAVYEVRQQL